MKKRILLIFISSCLSIGLARASPVVVVEPVNPDRYPAIMGFGYKGEFIDVLWLQSLEILKDKNTFIGNMRSTLHNGLVGEIIASRYHVPNNQDGIPPDLSSAITHLLMTDRFIAEYYKSVGAYSGAMRYKLKTYIEEEKPYDKALKAMQDLKMSLQQVPLIPESVPPSSPPVQEPFVQKHVYFAEAIASEAQKRLTEACTGLDQSIEHGDVATYDKHFRTIVSYADSAFDPQAVRTAIGCLDLSHDHRILYGQPLDVVIDKVIVPMARISQERLDLEQILLANKINLSSSLVADTRAHIAAMILVADDHQSAYPIDDLGLIIQSVNNLSWLVNHIVTARGDGSTAVSVMQEIDQIFELLN